jgi:hypothetical protein
VQGMRRGGGLRRRRGARRRRRGSRGAAWERMGAEEVLEDGKVGHGCVHHLREMVVGELGRDEVPTPELVFA